MACSQRSGIVSRHYQLYPKPFHLDQNTLIQSLVSILLIKGEPLLHQIVIGLLHWTGFHLVVLDRPPGPYSQFLEEFCGFIADLVTPSDKSERTQCVPYRNTSTIFTDVKYGFCQGSALGLLLFSLYISALGQIIWRQTTLSCMCP